MVPCPSAECRRLLTRNRALFCAVLLVASIAPTAPTLAAGIMIEKRLALGEWSPFGSFWESESPVCVWSESGEDAFRVTASGSVAGGRFTLGAGPGSTVGYRVFWYPRGRDGGFEELMAGTPSRLTAAADPLARCARDGARAVIRISIAGSDLEKAPPGVYRGELVLTLSPL